MLFADRPRGAAAFLLVTALLGGSTLFADPAEAPRAVSGFESAPLGFEPNLGQAEPSVRYLARGGGFALRLAEREARIRLGGGAAFRLRLAGNGPVSSWSVEERLAGLTHYSRGNDRSRWLRNVPSFRRVVQHGVFPGIDWVWYGTRSEPEYDFRVAPGASPRAIRFEIAEAESLSIAADGALQLSVGGRSLSFGAPRAYQETPNGRREVESRYRLRGRTVSFALGAYDSDLPLAIDPVLRVP